MGSDDVFNALIELGAEDSESCLAAQLQRYQDKLQNLKDDIDGVWMLLCIISVMILQIGFALVEAGVVQKNPRSQITKNVIVFCLAAATWLLLGESIAYGKGTVAIGLPVPFQAQMALPAIFRLSYAGMSATIVIGMISERTKLLACLLFAGCLAGLIYPVVVRWMWSPYGWMSPVNTTNKLFTVVDFAGAGVVHMVGGVAGLIGAIAVGPRPGIFLQCPTGSESKKVAFVRERLQASQLLRSVLGTFILWLGWYGLIGGQALGIVGRADIVSFSLINVAIAGVVSTVTTAILVYIVHRKVDAHRVIEACIAGLVSVSGGAPFFTPGMASIVALIGAILCLASTHLLIRFEIDDPRATFPIHGVCGFWGLIAVGLFGDVPSMEKEYGGLTFSHQVAYQLLGCVIVCAWTAVVSIIWLQLVRLICQRSLRNVSADVALEDAYSKNRVGPQGRVAMVATEINDLAVISETDPDSLEDSLQLHDTLLRTQAHKLDGYEVRFDHHSFLFAFSELNNAVQFVSEVQSELMKLPWPTSLLRCEGAKVEIVKGKCMFKGFRVSMGIHYCEPNIRNGQGTQRTAYSGSHVKYVAKLRTFASQGHCLASREVIEALLQADTSVNPISPTGGSTASRANAFSPTSRADCVGKEGLTPGPSLRLLSASPSLSHSSHEPMAMLGLRRNQAYSIPHMNLYIQYKGDYTLQGIEGCRSIFDLMPRSLLHRPKYGAGDIVATGSGVRLSHMSKRAVSIRKKSSAPYSSNNIPMPPEEGMLLECPQVSPLEDKVMEMDPKDSRLSFSRWSRKGSASESGLLRMGSACESATGLRIGSTLLRKSNRVEDSSGKGPMQSNSSRASMDSHGSFRSGVQPNYKFGSSGSERKDSIERTQSDERFSGAASTSSPKGPLTPSDFSSPTQSLHSVPNPLRARPARNPSDPSRGGRLARIPSAPNGFEKGLSYIPRVRALAGRKTQSVRDLFGSPLLRSNALHHARSDLSLQRIPIPNTPSLSEILPEAPHNWEQQLARV